MGSSAPRRREAPAIIQPNPRPALRMSVRDQLYTSKQNAELLVPTSLCGDSVYDVVDTFLGEIEEIALDIQSGRIAYALVAVGGFVGMRRRLFAIPWTMLLVDRAYQRCTIDVDLARLIGAPSLDDDDLLSCMSDFGWAVDVHAYFGCKPYWE